MILLMTDFYKVHHHRMYPEGTNLIYSNLIPRKSRIPGVKSIVVANARPVLAALQQSFSVFFEMPWYEIELLYREHIPIKDLEHIRRLHNLGYAPLQIKMLPEGTLCPIGVPPLTIRSTHEDGYWLVNYLESLLSTDLWKRFTAATIAHEYKKILVKWAVKTGGDLAFVDWQGHDFSMRGMSGIHDGFATGVSHLLSFTGTDTVLALYAMSNDYIVDKGVIVGGSVPATEHSVMCMGTKEDEIKTFERLLELYPDGILSVVSDTWDLWKVVTEFLPKLKDKIMVREGKLVIRPDSGDPADILCGEPVAEPYTKLYEDPKFKSRLYVDPEYKGLIELLWDLFGGTINEKGYKVLDSHIGAIYGDSITLDRAEQICSRLAAKGFASTNVVLGIGSYTYQYVTRDTFGFAIKATYGEVNGVGREIFKDPITDDGTKKSKKGLLMVYEEDGIIKVKDQCTWEEEEKGLLQTVFLDGKLLMEKPNLKEVRAKLQAKVLEAVGISGDGILVS